MDGLPRPMGSASSNNCNREYCRRSLLGQARECDRILTYIGLILLSKLGY
ncbi:hypothetical protein [Iningainema tapete]|uniref:Uncharacterized protein n=1 Tax=Iningainema tapete BLCC-T55 TaxID=2748662 RepID=A0A8J6XUD5_9CYAN|nr:hypothetical protein [Iningainema tapete]MBD2778669.1 hypothetical protein [Iningainema tapete BLCC-T55]